MDEDGTGSASQKRRGGSTGAGYDDLDALVEGRHRRHEVGPHVDVHGPERARAASTSLTGLPSTLASMLAGSRMATRTPLLYEERDDALGGYRPATLGDRRRTVDQLAIRRHLRGDACVGDLFERGFVDGQTVPVALIPSVKVATSWPTRLAGSGVVTGSPASRGGKDLAAFGRLGWVGDGGDELFVELGAERGQGGIDVGLLDQRELIALPAAHRLRVDGRDLLGPQEVRDLGDLAGLRCLRDRPAERGWRPTRCPARCAPPRRWPPGRSPVRGDEHDAVERRDPRALRHRHGPTVLMLSKRTAAGGRLLHAFAGGGNSPVTLTGTSTSVAGMMPAIHGRGRRVGGHLERQRADGLDLGADAHRRRAGTRTPPRRRRGAQDEASDAGEHAAAGGGLEDPVAGRFASGWVDRGLRRSVDVPERVPGSVAAAAEAEVAPAEGAAAGGTAPAPVVAVVGAGRPAA